MEWIQQLVNGISLGSIYALIALGYTMVYGIIKLINFAHGDVFMVGVIYWVLLQLRHGTWISSQHYYFNGCMCNIWCFN